MFYKRVMKVNLARLCVFTRSIRLQAVQEAFKSKLERRFERQFSSNVLERKRHLGRHSGVSSRGARGTDQESGRGTDQETV